MLLSLIYLISHKSQLISQTEIITSGLYMYIDKSQRDVKYFTMGSYKIKELHRGFYALYTTDFPQTPWSYYEAIR